MVVRVDTVRLAFYNMNWITTRLDSMEREVHTSGKPVKCIVLECQGNDD